MDAEQNFASPGVPGGARGDAEQVFAAKGAPAARGDAEPACEPAAAPGDISFVGLLFDCFLLLLCSSEMSVFGFPFLMSFFLMTFM